MTWKDARPEFRHRTANPQAEFDLELPQTETKRHIPEELPIGTDGQTRQYSLGGFIVGGIMTFISLPAFLLPLLTRQAPDHFWSGVGWMFTAIIMLWRSFRPMRWTQGLATLIGGMLVGWSVGLVGIVAAGAPVTANLIMQFLILLIPAALLIKIGARPPK
jgi:hypothetical protein